ncbi:MAG TPA: GAF domain-containing protein [Terriglobales bacterium]|nr:GAF domain-containing protein [Terriglobales bacterium]
MATLAETENLELDVVLRSVIHRARVLTCATGVAIALAHKGSMICRASLGSNAPSLGCRLDITSGFSGECVRSGKALRCDDSERDPRVDVTSCRRLGIRSLVAAPILFKGEVVGVLEVFSPCLKAFSEIDVTVVNGLAETLFATRSAPVAVPPAALAKTEPTHDVSVHKFIRAITSPTHAPVERTSATDHLWSDVFVRTQLPWRRFGESVVLHIMMIAVLGTLKLGIPRAQLVPEAINSSDVLYLPVESVRSDKRSMVSARTKQLRTEAKKELLSVAPEQRSRTEAMITPPDIKFKQQIRVLHLIAWRVLTPPVPAFSVSRTRMITPAALVGAIPPPPEISAVARPRALTPALAAVVGPPPSVRSSVGRRDKASFARLEVVSPPPQLSTHGQNLTFAAASASLGGSTLAAVIAPPPSVNDLESRGTQSAGSISAATTQIVPPPPPPFAAGNFNRLTGNDTGTQVIPPAPSLSHLENRSTHTKRLASSAPESGPTLLGPPRDSDLPATPSIQSNQHASAQVGDEGSGRREGATKPQEVSVAFIAPVLPLPSSSYFSSSEIFIAEEQVRGHQTRLIKLVYDYLPYQHRLSEDGPNYPELDKLRVTRDLNCDETLRQMTSGVGTSDGAATGKLTRDEYLRWQQATIPCFRTTADDYRKARVRVRK